jgi:hypothetical protein
MRRLVWSCPACPNGPKPTSVPSICPATTSLYPHYYHASLHTTPSTDGVQRYELSTRLHSSRCQDTHSLACASSLATPANASSSSTPRLLDSSTPRLLDSSTPRLRNSSTSTRLLNLDQQSSSLGPSNHPLHTTKLLVQGIPPTICQSCASPPRQISSHASP